MSKFFVLFIMLSAISVSQTRAQDSDTHYKYAIKVYNQSSYENYNYFEVSEPSGYYFDYSAERLQILHPTLAFQWNSGLSKSHEIELTGFSSDESSRTAIIRNDENGNGYSYSNGTVSSTYIALRYEYIRNFNKNKDAKFAPSFAGSISPFYRKNSFDPGLLFDENPSSQMAAGIKIFVIPRITWHISSKFFIDLNVPVCTADIAYTRDIERSPILSLDRQETNQFRFVQFPALYTGRLGFGFKI